MRNGIKVGLKVYLDYPGASEVQILVNSIRCILGRPLRAKAKGYLMEVCFQDGLQYNLKSCLYNAAANARFPEAEGGHPL